MKFTNLLALGLANLSSARILSRADAIDTKTSPYKLVVSAPNVISTYSGGDGDSITLEKTLGDQDKHFSWLAFKAPNHFYGCNENGKEMRHWTLGDDGTMTPVGSDLEGSAGVVHLAFNPSGSVLAGASYTNGSIDIWAVGDDGTIKFWDTVTPPGTGSGGVPGRQDGPHAHQIVWSPDGDYMIVNDLGTDKLNIISYVNDKWTFLTSYSTPIGCGPRHAAFSTDSTGAASHYHVVCELSANIETVAVKRSSDGLSLVGEGSGISTYGDKAAPTGTAPGELLVSADSKHLYVTNRITGDKTDNVAHFMLEDSGASLKFVGLTNSFGVSPRMASFSPSQQAMWVSNTSPDLDNSTSSIKFGSYPYNADGSLADEPSMSVAYTAEDIQLGPGFGPSFLFEVPSSTTEQDVARSSG